MSKEDSTGASAPAQQAAQTLSGPWLQTKSGRAWRPLDPDAYEYNFEEIAHALSNLCRFAGHTRQFYSVAQHSVVVAREVSRVAGDDRALVQAALLHDAAEAFCIDLPAPLKRMPELTGYRWIIESTERAIARQFSLEHLLDHPAIQHADLVALATEKRDVLNPGVYDAQWGADLPPPSTQRIAQCLTPENAKELLRGMWKVWR